MSAVPNEITTAVVRGADNKLYRRSALGIFFDENGFCLCLTPVGKCNASFLQSVQGGVEKGETPEEALLREVGEEVGLAPEDFTIVCEILPVDEHGEIIIAEAAATVNEQGEVVDEARKKFRYANKSWRKLGIYGQELYPHLCFLRRNKTRKIKLRPKDPEIRPEFYSYQWGKLASLYLQAPPSKRDVMRQIVQATYPVARQFLADNRYNVSNLGSVEDLNDVGPPMQPPPPPAYSRGRGRFPRPCRSKERNNHNAQSGAAASVDAPAAV